MNAEEATAQAGQSPPPAGEEAVLWDGHPSRWMFFRRYLLGALLAAGGLALGIWLRASQYAVGGGLILIGAALIVFLAVYLQRSRTRLTVTDRHISYEKGVFSRDAVDLPIRAITEIYVEQTFWQRLAHMGTLGLSTSASDATEIICHGMPHPERIRQLVRQYMSQ